MTVKELSTAISVPERTIHNAIGRLFPEMKKNGVKTELDGLSVSEVISDLKRSHNSELASSGKVITTDIEMIQKAQDFMAWATVKIKEETEKRIQAENKILLDAPKVEFFDAVTSSKDAIEMKDAAKVLNIGMGRTTLFQFLREKKILMENNTPYQEYIDRGYFRVIESKWVTPEGETKINLKTVVYQKGLDYIKKVAM